MMDADATDRAWWEDIGSVRLVKYDDGDLTIKQREEARGDSILSGFVLDDTQQDRLVEWTSHLLTRSDAATQKLGTNCLGSPFVVAYEPDADAPYQLGDGTNFLSVSESTFRSLRSRIDADHSS